MTINGCDVSVQAFLLLPNGGKHGSADERRKRTKRGTVAEIETGTGTSTGFQEYLVGWLCKWQIP